MTTVEELAQRPIEAGHVKPVIVTNPESDPANVRLVSTVGDVAVADASTDNTDAPAADTVASVAFPAEVGRRHVIGGIAWSYGGAPTGGNLRINDAGGIVFQVDIVAGGPSDVDFLPSMRFALGAAISITLAAGGGGVSGKLNVKSHWTVAG